MVDRWLTPGEAAARLGVDTSAVYQLVLDEELPAYRRDRRLWLHAGDVERWRRGPA